MILLFFFTIRLQMGPQDTAKQHGARKTMMTGNIDLGYQNNSDNVPDAAGSEEEIPDENGNINEFHKNVYYFDGLDAAMVLSRMSL